MRVAVDCMYTIRKCYLLADKAFILSAQFIENRNLTSWLTKLKVVTNKATTLVLKEYSNLLCHTGQVTMVILYL